MRLKKGNILLILGALTLAALAVVGPFRFKSGSVCTICGREQLSSERQLPLMDVTYWRTDEIRETPLSKAIDEGGLAVPHEHSWLFGHGGGNAIMCALGNGQHARTAATNPHVGVFVGSVARYDGKAAAEKWVRMLLDPDRAAAALRAVRTAETPPGGFATEDAYRKWWAAREKLVVRTLKVFLADERERRK